MSASIRSLVEVSARRYALTMAYCRKFIASALPAGPLALCVLSLYLVTGGHPSFWGALAFLGVGITMIYVARPVLAPQRAQRQSEQVSEKSEERYRLLAECANDMITVHDRRGQVMFVSQAAQQLLGATAPNVLGGGLLEHVHVGDRPAYLSALNRCSADDEPTSVELRLRRDASNKEQALSGLKCGVSPCRRRAAGVQPQSLRSRETLRIIRSAMPICSEQVERPRARTELRASSLRA